MDFNFNPPFLGDILGGTLKVPSADDTVFADAVPLKSGPTH